MPKKLTLHEMDLALESKIFKDHVQEDEEDEEDLNCPTSPKKKRKKSNLLLKFNKHSSIQCSNVCEKSNTTIKTTSPDISSIEP
jgi:hypothetical protein